MKVNHRAWWIVLLWCVVVMPAAALAETALLNVSYDPTRELYDDLNPKFIAKWKAEKGTDITIAQSHGGSGKQALLPILTHPTGGGR